MLDIEKTKTKNSDKKEWKKQLGINRLDQGELLNAVTRV